MTRNVGVNPSRRRVKGQNPPTEPLVKNAVGVGQHAPTPSIRQHPKSGSDLRRADGRHEETASILAVQPAQHLRMWTRSHQFRQDVGVQDDRSPVASVKLRRVAHRFSRRNLQIHAAKRLEQLMDSRSKLSDGLFRATSVGGLIRRNRGFVSAGRRPRWRWVRFRSWSCAAACCGVVVALARHAAGTLYSALTSAIARS